MFLFVLKQVAGDRVDPDPGGAGVRGQHVALPVSVSFDSHLTSPRSCPLVQLTR